MTSAKFVEVLSALKLQRSCGIGFSDVRKILPAKVALALGHHFFTDPQSFDTGTSGQVTWEHPARASFMVNLAALQLALTKVETRLKGEKEKKPKFKEEHKVSAFFAFCAPCFV